MEIYSDNDNDDHVRWKNPEVMPLYYTIEKKEDSQSAEWEPLTDHKIDPEEASYLSKILITIYSVFLWDTVL